MSVAPCSLISWAVTTAVGLVADMLAGTGMREPVTMTSWSTGAWSAVVAGACCAVAVVAMPAMHTHADIIAHRFASDLKLISFGFIIFSLPRSELYVAARSQVPRLPLCCGDMKYERLPL